MSNLVYNLSYNTTSGCNSAVGEQQNRKEEKKRQKKRRGLICLTDIQSHGCCLEIRSEEGVLARACIGHFHLTHGFLLRKEDQPQRIPCGFPLSIKLVFTDCADLVFTNRRLICPKSSLLIKRLVFFRNLYVLEPFEVFGLHSSNQKPEVHPWT